MSRLAWCTRSRSRITVGALMAAIALVALAINAFRPPSRVEAELIAARYADPSGWWQKRLLAHARPSFPEDSLVDVTDTSTGEVAEQIAVSSWGRSRAMTVNPGYWQRLRP